MTHAQEVICASGAELAAEPAATAVAGDDLVDQLHHTRPRLGRSWCCAQRPR